MMDKASCKSQLKLKLVLGNFTRLARKTSTLDEADITINVWTYVVALEQSKSTSL